MRNFIAAVVVSQALLLSAQAATVGWSSDQANSLALANGTLTEGDSLLLTDRALLRIGFFTITDAAIASNFALGNFQLITNSFQEFGTSRVGNGYNTDGVWSASSVNTNVAFTGQRIHIWAYNSGTATATPGASQWGIFTNPTALNWLFPSDSPTPGSTNVDLSEVPKNSTGLIVGSFGPPNDPTFNAPTYKLAVLVPEPSSVVLIGAGVLGLFGIRRRRSHMH